MRPGECVLEAVVAPEQLARDDEARRAEQPRLAGPLGLPAQCLLAVRRAGSGQQRAGQQFGDHLLGADVPVIGEIGLHHASAELADPGLVLAEAGHPGGQQSVARKHAGTLQAQAVAFAQALEIAPHVAPLRRVDVERRIVPAKAHEYRAQQERAPCHVDLGGGRQCLDAHHRQVGIGARELVPELDGRAPDARFAAHEASRKASSAVLTSAGASSGRKWPDGTVWPETSLAYCRQTSSTS